MNILLLSTMYRDPPNYLASLIAHIIVFGIYYFFASHNNSKLHKIIAISSALYSLCIIWFGLLIGGISALLLYFFIFKKMYFEASIKKISEASPEFDHIVSEFNKVAENLRIPITFEEKSEFINGVIKNTVNLQNFTSIFLYCLSDTTVDPLRNIFRQHKLQYGELTNAERDFLSSIYLFKPTNMLVIPDNYATYFVKNALIANHSADRIAKTAAENRLIGLLKDYGTYENLKNKLKQNIRRLSKKDRQALLYFHNNRDKTYAYNSTSQLDPFILALTGLEELRFNMVVLMELSHEVFDEIHLAEYINTCTDEKEEEYNAKITSTATKIDTSVNFNKTLNNGTLNTPNNNVKLPGWHAVFKEIIDPHANAFRALDESFTSMCEDLRYPITSWEREKFDKWLSQRKINLDTMLDIFLYCLDSATTFPLVDLFSQCEYKYEKVSHEERIFLSTVYLFKTTGALVIPDDYTKNFVTNVLILNHTKDTEEYTIAKNRIIYLVKEFGSYENLKNQLAKNFEKIKKSNINEIQSTDEEITVAVLENLVEFAFIDVVLGEALDEVVAELFSNYDEDEDIEEEADEDNDAMSDIFGDLDDIYNVDEDIDENILNNESEQKVDSSINKNSTKTSPLKNSNSSEPINKDNINFNDRKNATPSLRAEKIAKAAKKIATKTFDGSKNFMYHARCLTIAYIDIILFKIASIEDQKDFLNIATLDVSNDYNLSINFINTQIGYYGLKLSKNIEYVDIVDIIATAISEDAITPINDQTPLEILDIPTQLDYVARIASLHSEIALCLKEILS